MSEKRKDNNGRVLKAGESQRANGTYMFRYTTPQKERKCLYAKTLEELRIKEDAVTKNRLDGISDEGDKITVYELLCQYLDLKRNLKQTTLHNYDSIKKKVKNTSIGSLKVSKVKPYDVKRWCIELSDLGFKYSTISVWIKTLRSAFNFGIENDLIRKNPFAFVLSTVIVDDTSERVALTKKQKEQYLKCLDKYGDPIYSREIKILLATGLRIGELYGLTYPDIDFENLCIHVTKQLQHDSHGVYRVTTPKTSSSNRTIPITADTAELFRDVIVLRKKVKVEPMVDGYAGFLFVTCYGNPQSSVNLEGYMKKFHEKVRAICGSDFPKITPHNLRHTFCTEAMNAGMDLKTLQYLMGHSSASMTLDTYSHANYDSVKETFMRLLG